MAMFSNAMLQRIYPGTLMKTPPLSCSRRHFLNLTACAGCALGTGLFSPRGSRAAAAGVPGKVKVRAVFCETSNDKPIWPNLGYDFEKRRQLMLSALTQGCPQIEWHPVVLKDDPQEAERALADAEVQGYLICLQGLGWNHDLTKLCSTGKPTLLADNLFGGAGMLLTRLPGLMKSGHPIDWISSAREDDLVSAARHFGLLTEGKSPAEVVAAFRADRHAKTPGWSEMKRHSDTVAPPDFEQTFEELRKTRLLVVGGGWGGDEFRKAAAEVTGVEIKPLDFPELAAAYEAADAEESKAFAERWMAAAQKVVEPSRDDILKSGVMYVAMKKLLSQYDAHGISINCLGGFYGGHLKAYPCLGFSEFNNQGLVGGCEGDQMSALTLTLIGKLFGRSGFISDPVLDTSRNTIIYAHCVATTKPFGPKGAANPYRIRSHSEDRKGAAIQSLLPAGYLVTTLEINPVSRQVLMHQAQTIGNNSSDMACRTKVEAVVKGDIEKLAENWRMGWHRVTFYGDLKPYVSELCQRLKMELVEEA